jgi:hypothetical protein
MTPCVLTLTCHVPWNTELQEDMFQRDINEMRGHLGLGEDPVDGEAFIYGCTRVRGTGPTERYLVVLDSTGKTELEVHFVSGPIQDTAECTHKNLMCPCVMAKLMTRLA